MKLYIIGKQSLKAILTNKGRSFLTVLGIIIGIASVIALISMGAGVQVGVADNISTLGTSNITISPGAGFATGMSGPGADSGGGMKSPHGGSSALSLGSSTLTVEDLNALQDKSKNPGIKGISGQISNSAIFASATGESRYTILGTSPAYLNIQKMTVAQGVFYEKTDLEQTARVIVLGSQMAANLFGDSQPIGQNIDVAGRSFQVIGVLAAEEESSFNNPNNQAYIPYTAAAETFESANFSSITVQAENEAAVEGVKESIQKTLLGTHQIHDEKLADFSVTTAADLLSAMSTITNMLTALLAGIAAISLLVGGIGIMNIMLVSVTERTREIGLRKAVGAKTSDILGQFILEAVLLTVAGGIIGIGLGFLIGGAAAPHLGFTPIVSGSTIALAVGVSTIVGLAFGVYPAAKAARLNPIEALRYE